MKIAFQGEPGAFSEEAVHALLGADCVTLPCRDFTDVSDALRNGVADYALLPIENSIHGPVTPTFDILATGDFRVIDGIVRPIRLCLAALPGTKLDELHSVASHPVALAQCQRFLRQHPHLRQLATHDTAGAAREAAPGRAAISSHAAAALYGLNVLAEDVQDRSDNQTRFVLLRRVEDDDVALPGGRVLLLIDLRDAPGALLDVLSPFAARGINLTSIQSRPAGEPWTYRFFVELTGSGGLAEALEDVRQRCLRVQVLGGTVTAAGAGPP